MSGRFLGMLPNRRTFEFRDSVIDRVISGRIDFAVKNADSINDILDRPAKATVVSRQVGAAGRRYVLIGYELERVDPGA